VRRTKVTASIQQLRSADRTRLRDAWACKFLSERRDVRNIFVEYPQAKNQARLYYAKQPEATKREWAKHQLHPELYPMYVFPSFSDFRSWLDSKGALVTYDPAVAEANQVSPFSNEFEVNKESRTHGYMLCWHGRWGKDKPEVKTLMDARDLPLPAVVAAVTAEPFYEWLWGEFKKFSLERCEVMKWPKKSGKMEITIARKHPANLVHFHLAVTDPSKAHRLRDPQAWSFMGSQPHIVPAIGRGRYLFKALDVTHYYCQAPKFGAVFMYTNYAAFKECLVELSTVFGIWRRYKMDSEIAKEELMKTRGKGTRGYLYEIDQHVQWETARREKGHRMLVESLVKLRPSKIIPEVVDWMMMHSNGFGQFTRFPFLVLNGPSKHGKTLFARSLYGFEHTLVLSCQGVIQPNLKSFSRETCLDFSITSVSRVGMHRNPYDMFFGSSEQFFLDLCWWLY
jgi:hypothetical protein